MVINVRKEFEKRETAKSPTPKPPVQTSAANQRENRAPTPTPTQTLNLYGSPATNTRPTNVKQETPKKTTKTPTAGEAASARLQAEADAYFAANPDIDPLTGKTIYLSDKELYGPGTTIISKDDPMPKRGLKSYD